MIPNVPNKLLPLYFISGPQITTPTLHKAEPVHTMLFIFIPNCYNSPKKALSSFTQSNNCLLPPFRKGSYWEASTSRSLLGKMSMWERVCCPSRDISTRKDGVSNLIQSSRATLMWLGRALCWKSKELLLKITYFWNET